MNGNNTHVIIHITTRLMVILVDATELLYRVLGSDIGNDIFNSNLSRPV